VPVGHGPRDETVKPLCLGGGWLREWVAG